MKLSSWIPPPCSKREMLLFDTPDFSSMSACDRFSETLYSFNASPSSVKIVCISLYFFMVKCHLCLVTILFYDKMPYLSSKEMCFQSYKVFFFNIFSFAKGIETGNELSVIDIIFFKNQIELFSFYYFFMLCLLFSTARFWR